MFEEERGLSANMTAIGRMLRRAEAAGYGASYGASYGRYVSDYDPPAKPVPKKKRRARRARVAQRIG